MDARREKEQKVTAAAGEEQRVTSGEKETRG